MSLSRRSVVFNQFVFIHFTWRSHYSQREGWASLFERLQNHYVDTFIDCTKLFLTNSLEPWWIQNESRKGVRLQLVIKLMVIWEGGVSVGFQSGDRKHTVI